MDVQRLARRDLLQRDKSAMIPNHHVNEGFAICVWGFPPVQDLLITCALPSINSYQSVRCLGKQLLFFGFGGCPRSSPLGVWACHPHRIGAWGFGDDQVSGFGHPSVPFQACECCPKCPMKGWETNFEHLCFPNHGMAAQRIRAIVGSVGTRLLRHSLRLESGF